MAVPVFGLTHTDVRSAYFPSLAAFGASTKPTSTEVGNFIERASADLFGRLVVEGVTPATISTDAGVTYPAAYEWSQDYILLGAAIRTITAQAGAGAVPKAWREELDSMRTRLDDFGYLALGDAPAPSVQSEGPRSHGLEHSLDTGDVDDMSDLIPPFRKSDLL